jgi:uncharacterized protein involved in outer membrane biogenesis
MSRRAARSMKKFLTLAGYLSLAFILFFIVVSLAFYHLARGGDFRRYLISALEQQTAMKVQLGESDLEIGAILGVSFGDVALAESDLATPALKAERVTARVALWPLLKRQLVFSEVRLKRPHIRLIREPGGEIPLLERLLNLPFLKEQHGEFQLDLRTVKIFDGRFEFIDRSTDTAPVITRFHDVALALERERGAAVQQRLRQWVGSAPKQPEGAALNVELVAAVERQGQRAEWRADGKLIFPGDKFDLAQAWCDIETRISGTPMALAQMYGARQLAVKDLGGSFESRLRLQGNLRQRLDVKGTVDIGDLFVDAPELFTAALDAGDGRLELDLQLQPQRWTVSRMDYRSKELAFGMKGELRGALHADMRLQAEFSAKPLQIGVLKKYFPARWLGTAPPGLLGALTEGELLLRKAGMNATLSEIGRILENPTGEQFWFEAEIQKGTANFSGYPPLRAVKGSIALENGRIAFHKLSGIYGQSRLSALDGSYNLTAGGLQLRARGEADLGELREHAQRGILPAELTKALLSVQALGGTSKFDVGLTRLADGTARAEGNLALEKARLLWGAYAFTELEGDLEFTPAEIKTESIRAVIYGSPVDMRLNFRNYAAADGKFDVALESIGVKAGMLSTLLFDRGSIHDPGIVRGALRYRGSINDKHDRKLTGNLELVNVQLPAHPLAQPLRRLSGKISIDEAGIDFQNLQGLLVGVPASASGRWRYAQKPQLVFDLAAPELDISYLISQIDPEPTGFYATLQAEGRVTLGKGRLKGLDFTELKSNLVLDRRTWRFPNLTLRGGGGAVSGPLVIAHKPDALGIASAPKIQNVPMAALLRWLEITHSEITGTVDIAGKFDTSGRDETERKRNLSGAFSLRISDGTIHRMRMLVQLLNVLDLSRWFTFQLPDLTKQGIRFRAITGDFTVSRGIYYTDNLVVDSDDLRMTGAGKIDVANDEIDLLVAVRPFAGVDTAINYIPLLGRGIAAVKNSLLVASFNIRGRIDDPAITPAPLGTLSEWVFGVLRIPRSLLPLAIEDQEMQNEPAEKTAVPNR